ncbi:MAG: hypothetical protein M9962_11190 [Oligoflexia bacterium]|nr:hypothetical protein [Oligoflexia bacterium]
MIRIILISALSFAALVSTAQASSDMELRLGAFGVYDQSSLSRPTGGKAYFSGSGYGFSGEMKATTTKGYGLGFRVSYETTNLNNNSNEATVSESLSTKYISIVPRIYALDLFFGLGVTYNSLFYKQTAGSITTESYSGIGARLELGYDWYFSKSVYISSLLSYGISKVRAETTTVNSSYNPFTISLGLGVKF